MSELRIRVFPGTHLWPLIEAVREFGGAPVREGMSESAKTRADACANAATTDVARAALLDLSARLVPPAVLGFRCVGYPDRTSPVEVSVYRDVQADEDGIRCGVGTVSAYDGAVYWYIAPPEEVLR
jgi:hypothetical protein